MDLSETGDRQVVVELAAAMPEMIAEQLAGWGSQVEVISPDSVRQRLGGSVPSLPSGTGADLVGPGGHLSSGIGRVA